MVKTGKMKSHLYRISSSSEIAISTGETKDEVFNSKVSSKLGFLDHLKPDSNEWIDMIPKIHPNTKELFKHNNLQGMLK